MKKAAWSKQFETVYRKIRERFSDEILSEESLIFAACKNNLISSKEYLNWAKDFYGVAILNHNFFEEKFNSLTYNNYKEIFDWSVECFPVFQWEEFIYVVCLDPHLTLNIPFDYKVKPLLVTYEDLIFGWNKLQSSKSKNTSLSEDLDLLTVMQESIGPNAEGVDGADDSDSAFAPEFDINIHQKPSTESIQEIQMDQQNEFPVGLAENEISNLSNENSVKFHITDEKSEFSNPGFILHTEVATESVLVPNVPPPKSPPPPPAPPPTPDFHDFTQMTQMTQMTSLMTSHVQENQSLDESEIKKLKLILEPILKEIFLESNKYFSMAMYLVCPKANVCRPLCWDEQFEFNESKKSSLNEEIKNMTLSVPSPFRIAYMTKKPFHGRIFKNPITDLFFENWLKIKKINDKDLDINQLSLTLIPVCREHSVDGLFLFFKNDFNQSQQALDFAGTLAEKFKEEFKILVGTKHSA